MPLFDYECQKCGTEFEAILPVSECDRLPKCPKCDGKTKKIVTLGHGGIWRKGDAVSWVKDAAMVLTDGDHPNRNMETVDDYRDYLKRHPKVVPKESHPCLPSSIGDCFYKKPDPVLTKKKRKEKGEALIRKMRSITVNSDVAGVT